ncbi:7-carboxy-7-deazaguanine synthase QueE [bacterium]|nr:7-carboxy-7-deazaguanine synthase QueE [bacterium]
MKKYSPNLVPFAASSPGALPVNEIFYSLQGEGRFSGYSAIFIRLQYCNLGCSWCDTRYTWEKNAIDSGHELDFHEIVARVKKLIPASIKSKPHIIFTGGEPMLHQEQLPELIKLLNSVGFDFFEIETNCTILPNEQILELITWWNCSPKLSNNRIAKEERIKSDVIQLLAAQPNRDFKFVVRNEDDVLDIFESYGDWVPHDSIWLMPEGLTRADQLRAMPEIVELCIRYGLRFSPRIHTLVWDNERAR